MLYIKTALLYIKKPLLYYSICNRKIFKNNFFKAKNINDGVGLLYTDGGDQGRFGREMVLPPVEILISFM